MFLLLQSSSRRFTLTTSDIDGVETIFRVFSGTWVRDGDLRV